MTPATAVADAYLHLRALGHDDPTAWRCALAAAIHCGLLPRHRHAPPALVADRVVRDHYVRTR